MTTDQAEPSPVAGVVVAGLLRLIAAGLEPIEAVAGDPGTTTSVLTVSGWWLLLGMDDEGRPVELFHAQPPSPLVPPWTWGCQRDDWTLGPDSRVVTPVELLTSEQRVELQQRLGAAPAPWVLPLMLGWDVSNLEDEELILD